MSLVPRRRRAERLLRIALLLSLFVHFTGAALYGVLSARLPRLRSIVPHPRATESFVTLTQALTFDKRPHPAPRSHPHPITRPLRIAHVVPAPIPAPAHPRPIVHEEIPRPKAPVVHVPKVARVASSGLTQERIARLNQDFVQTIAASRGAENPLRVSTHVPTATIKSYHLQFEGHIGTLRVGQGLLTPIKKWFADGYNYYYVTYEIVWPDGTYESGAVPWPIRYRPSDDPFERGVPGRRIPLPAPLAGWELPAGIHLGKALREYFPGYKDSEG